jgi:hypothetical protein
VIFQAALFVTAILTFLAAPFLILTSQEAFLFLFRSKLFQPLKTFLQVLVILVHAKVLSEPVHFLSFALS